MKRTICFSRERLTGYSRFRVLCLCLVVSWGALPSFLEAAPSLPANKWIVMPNNSKQPGFRGWQQLSFDLEFRELILFGGSGATYMSDTWTYNLDNNAWRLRRAHPDLDGPCRRDMHSMVYDPVEKVHWLFNGIAYHNLQPKCPGRETRAGIWNYDRARNEWTKRNDVANINQRLAPGVAYNPDDRSLLQFGGSRENSTNTTFRFDLERWSWKELRPSRPLPNGRINIEGGLVYDRANKVFVLFGGKGAGAQNDTWLFDPRTSSWREMKPEVSPPPRDLPALVYDEANRVTILFGGRGRGGKLLNDTWIYDAGSNTWRELAGVSSPPGLAHHSGVYDPHHGAVIVTTGREVLVFKYVPVSNR